MLTQICSTTDSSFFRGDSLTGNLPFGALGYAGLLS